MQQFKTVLILVVCGLYATSVAGAGCSDDGYFVDEQDCQSYYQCVEGLRHDFKCNDGLKFDTDTFTCTWPQEANCVNSGIKQTTPKPGPKPEPSPPTAECPNGDGYFVVEDDCTRFYGCAGGVRHYYNCPAGLKYDTVSHNCLEPADAKCTN